MLIKPGIADVPVKRHTMAKALMRIRGLEVAGELVGKGVLAAKMGLPERTLRSYMAVERGMPANAISAAADALERRCAEIAAHVAKLRALADDDAD